MLGVLYSKARDKEYVMHARVRGARLKSTALVMCGIASLLPSCSVAPAQSSKALGRSTADVCEVVREWEQDGVGASRRLEPIVDAVGSDTIYRFASPSSSVRSLEAICGNGPYSECDVSIALTNGRKYGFSELSRFTLWRADDGLWMAYRVQSPRSPADQAKRRIVKIAPAPVTLCNEIGDYSDLM